jgi:hypothetical protein
MIKIISVNTKNLTKLMKKHKDKITRALTSSTLLKQVGDEMIKDIRYQTRRGLGGEDGDERESLKPLSKSWKESRKEIASRGGQTHQAFSANRSNLTLSGQLLDSISIVDYDGPTVTIGFKGVHVPYQIPYLKYFVRKKNKRKTGVNNRTVKGFQSSAGGMSYVNTNRSGMRTIGEPIANTKLAKYVQEKRPFFSLRPSFINRLKSLVIRHIRRNLK